MLGELWRTLGYVRSLPVQGAARAAECEDMEEGDLTHPEGSFEAISAWAGALCGLRTDGYVTCQDVDTSHVLRPPAGPLSSVTSSSGTVCGVMQDESIACWGGGSSGRDSIPSGAFTSVDAKGGLCGVKTDGSVVCREKWLGLNLPAGPFASVSTGWGYYGNGFSCGVKRDGSVACWGPDYETSLKNVAIPPGPYSAISAGGYICGVRTDGSIACWGQQYDPGEIPDGPFASVSVGISQACGVKTDGSVRCWGDDSAGQAYSPPGTFVAVSVSGSGSGRFSCGLKADGSAMCWGTTLPR